MCSTVNFNEILLASLLKFEKVNLDDIFLFQNWLIKNNKVNYSFNNSNCLNKFFKYENNFFELKTNNFSLSDSLTKKIANIKDELDNININILTLKKIEKTNLITSINKEDLINQFCNLEINSIKKMIINGDLNFDIDDYNVYSNSKNLKLSKQGKVKLFIYDNKTKYNTFFNVLSTLNYDSSIISGYLENCNLSDPVEIILNPFSFENYCEKENLNFDKRKKMILTNNI